MVLAIDLEKTIIIYEECSKVISRTCDIFVIRYQEKTITKQLKESKIWTPRKSQSKNTKRKSCSMTEMLELLFWDIFLIQELEDTDLIFFFFFG